MRRFFAAQLGLAVAFLLAFLELKTVSGGSPKWSAEGAWAPVGKVKPTSEVSIPAAKAIELNKAAEPVRAVILEGTLSGGFALELGDTTAPELAEFTGLILKVTAGATMTHSGALRLKSTSATRLAIAAAKPLSSSSMTLVSGKYEVTENLSFTGAAVTIKVENATDLKIGSGKTVKCSVFQIEGEGTVTLDITNATIACKEYTGNPATLTSTGSTVEITGTETGQFNGAKKAFNVVTLAMRAGKVDGEATVATLNVFNKGTGEGWKFKPFAAPIIKFGSLNFNGEAGALCRVESETAGEKWKLEREGKGDYEPANSFTAVKDLTYEGGILYLPHGEDLGGNTNVHFEAKPVEGVTFKDSGTVTATATLTSTETHVLTGTGTATASPTLTGAGLHTASGAGTATATHTLSGTGAHAHTGTGTCSSSPTLTGHDLHVLVDHGTAQAVTALTGVEHYETGKPAAAVRFTPASAPTLKLTPASAPTIELTPAPERTITLTNRST